MKKLVIFDLDGTLVNSLEDLADSVNIALRTMHFNVHDVEEYRYFVGNGVMKLCERALPEENRSEENLAALYSIFTERYADCCCNKTRPYDGISELLCRLKESGVLLAVASNKTHTYCLEIVSKLFGDNAFDAICGSDNGFAKKPSPDVIFDIMKRFGISQADTLLVGDSNVDIETAKNASVESVGCLWGFRTEHELLSAGANHIAKQPLDILKYI